jgi:hypothetical protein
LIGDASERLLQLIQKVAAQPRLNGVEIISRLLDVLACLGTQ